MGEIGLPVVDCSWPELMKREMFACRTLLDRRLWEERWADRLSGRIAAQLQAGAMVQWREAVRRAFQPAL